MNLMEIISKSWRVPLNTQNNKNMIFITIPIAVVAGLIIAKYYKPKGKSEKIWASILIPLISGVLIHLLVASCRNSGYGFAFDLGATMVFVAIPAVALLTTLFIALKAGKEDKTIKDTNETFEVPLHYGTGDNRVDFELQLTKEEIVRLGEMRREDPARWEDNDLELVKAVKKELLGENSVQEEVAQEALKVAEITSEVNVSKVEEGQHETQFVDKSVPVTKVEVRPIQANEVSDDNQTIPETQDEAKLTPNKKGKKKDGNTLSKWLKVLLIVILTTGVILGLGVLISFVYIRYVYPSKAKAEDEKLIQEAKDNPSKAYEIAQEMFKRHGKGHQSEFRSLFSGEHGICLYNHEQAGKEIAKIYCQYMKEYSKKNLSMSDEIARSLFMNYDNHCRQLYNETGIEILKYAAEHGESGAQFAIGCYYNGLNYTKDDSWWSGTTIDNKKLDPAKAAYWYSKAADQGNTAAMGNLGMAYIQGEGVNRNEQKGLGLIVSAAESGNAFYQCRLGDFYRDGVKMQVGTHKETRKDTDGGWYDSEDKVREYWDDYRMEWVTVYQIEVADYKTILPRDMKQAKYWWKKAADNGNETAKERLQQIYE